jgi:hypothetical protein
VLAKVGFSRTTGSVEGAARVRGDQSRELLAQVSGWFSEGLDTPDLKEANALLNELAPEGVCGRDTSIVRGTFIR